MRTFPRARPDVLATVLEEEVVVYDPERQRAHSLNRAAVAVWKQCNGQNSITELGRLVSAELGLQIDEGTVWLALRRLESAHLLVNKIDGTGALSRRDILRRAGRIGVAAVATPMVASAFVPLAAAAASRPTGLPACGPAGGEDESDISEEQDGCSTLNPSCVCSNTTTGVRICINPSTALKNTTCKKDTDCHPGYLCIPRGNAPPRCIAPCAVPTCRC